MEGGKSGHLKFYILKLLLTARYTGYGLMKAIKEETGFWKPSTGSLYPLLSTMKEQGLIKEIREPDGGKRWEITRKGREMYTEATEAKRKLFQDMRESMLVFAKAFDRQDLEAIADRLGHWGESGKDPGGIALLFMEVHDALWSLPPLSPADRKKVAAILTRARDELRRLRERIEHSPPQGGSLHEPGEPRMIEPGR